MRGLIFNTLKDIATKDPEKTKEVLFKLKAKAEAITPEERQRLLAAANDLKAKALDPDDRQKLLAAAGDLKARALAMEPEDRQKLLATANELKARAMNLSDDQRAKIADVIKANAANLKKPR